MSKKRRERRKKKKSRDGRRQAQKIDVLRGEEGKGGCPSASRACHIKSFDFREAREGREKFWSSSSGVKNSSFCFHSSWPCIKFDSESQEATLHYLSSAYSTLMFASLCSDA